MVKIYIQRWLSGAVSRGLIFDVEEGRTEVQLTDKGASRDACGRVFS